MITNTELEQLIALMEKPAWKDSGMEKVSQICKELLCAREVIKHAEQYLSYSTVKTTNRDRLALVESLETYDALCAPQEKTGEVK